LSGLLFPTLLGQTLNLERSYQWNTGKQRALSGKGSTIAYRGYPLIHYELEFEVLFDNITPSDLKALVGFFNQVMGGFDSFLYSDPEFNSVPSSAPQQFGTGNGTAGPFQLVGFYQNSGGPGTAEMIQNLNGTPVLYDNGSAITATNYTIGPTGIVTFLSGHFPVTGHALTWSGNFYNRCRFDEDDIPWKKFLNKRWSAKKVAFTTWFL